MNINGGLLWKKGDCSLPYRSSVMTVHGLRHTFRYPVHTKEEDVFTEAPAFFSPSHVHFK